MFMHLTSLCIKKKFYKENPVGFPQCKNLVGILHRFASFRMLLEGLQINDATKIHFFSFIKKHGNAKIGRWKN